MTSADLTLVHFSVSLYRGPALSGPVGWLVELLLPLDSAGEADALGVALTKSEHVGPATERSVPAAGASGRPPRSNQRARLEARESEIRSSRGRRTTNQFSRACGITQSRQVCLFPLELGKSLPNPEETTGIRQGTNPQSRSQQSCSSSQAATKLGSDRHSLIRGPRGRKLGRARTSTPLCGLASHLMPRFSSRPLPYNTSAGLLTPRPPRFSTCV
jgi:hypothetical protein